MEITIIGAGNGGLAMAADLSLKGFKVNLYSKYEEELSTLISLGGIELEKNNKVQFAKLNKITNNLKEAITNSNIIMVVTPAFAHLEIAELSAHYFNEEQIVLLNPGRTGGALEFNKVLDKKGVKNKPIIGETQTLIYSCRKLSSSKVKILEEKKLLAFSALPASDNEKLFSKIKNLYPQFVAAKNILETSLNNFGTIFHPAPTILNFGRIESKEIFEYYHEGITPTIALFLEKMDLERLQVAKALKVKTETVKDYLKKSYVTKGKTLYELIQNNKAYGGIIAPNKINIRYITEDVPTGLVPIASIANQIGIATPCINSIIKISSVLMNENYLNTGRTAKKLGFQNLSAEEIVKLVTE